MRQRTDGAMARAGLSLGSNLEPEANLRSAIAELRARFGDVRLSRVYRTRAVGFDGGDFLNAAAVIETDLEPGALDAWLRSEEHTSELQSLMRISYAVFCLKKKKETQDTMK